jgi:ferritin-like protein
MEAEIITETQRRNEKSERSHAKARKRRLRELGIDLPSLRCCIMDHVAL